MLKVVSRLFLGRMFVTLALAGATHLVMTPDALAQPHTWSPTGGMALARSEHTATLLLDGTVLVVGGRGSGTVLDSAEVYDPASGIWTAAGSLTEARSRHTATLLADGRVLVTGGANASAFLASAEVYDPATGSWSPAGSMSVPRGSMSVVRDGHTATLLPDGRVLVTGGDSTLAPLGPPEVFLASAEIYDPATGIWSPTGSMTTGRLGHTATLLSDGRVMAAGGFDVYHTAVGFAPIKSAEVYDPASGIWFPTDGMERDRLNPTRTVLADGRVLVAAGAGGNNPFDTAEVYNPSTSTWSLTGGLAARRWTHSAARLPDGRVMVAGGFVSAPPPALNISTASVEVYDPSVGIWSSINSMVTARTHHTATALPDGRILVAGGYNRSSFFSTVFLASAEVYNAAPPPSLSIDDVAVTEGHTGTANAIFTVTLSAASAQVITVDFATADATATASSDYTGGAGSLTFSPGETMQSIAILVNGDVKVEADETFIVVLSNASIATITDSQGIGTVTNDDVASLSIGDVVVTEGNSGTTNAVFTVTLFPASFQVITVDFATADGTATASSDYTGGAGTLTFNPGETTQSIAILVNGDMSVEPDEKFVVTLSNASNATIAGSQGLGTIATDDWALSIGDVAVTEADLGRMATPRSSHTATRLLDGRVLVAGRGSAEVYDPFTGVWSAAGNMSDARFVHTATLLPAGGVLIAGGYNNTSAALASAEVYDPSTGTWSSTGSMATPRANHTATRLVDGRVVVMGGRNDIVSAEVYEPLTGTWSSAGSMSQARAGHASTLMSDGRVLVAGGFDHTGQLASAEVYDPATNTWSPTGGMTAARYWFSFAWALPDGRVLVAGSFGSGRLASAEMYEPSTGTWSPAGSMAEGRGAHRTTLLLDGSMLVTGGLGVGGRLASAEVYNPATGTWSSAGARNAVFTVTLSSASAQPITVDFATADGTATAGSDYTAAAGIVTFNPGETTRPIVVVVNGDINLEPDETFFINLSNPTIATISDGQAQGTILDNDAPRIISINDVTVTEGDAGFINAVFTVSLSAASSQTITVELATANGTAAAPLDYAAKTRTLTFAPGQIDKSVAIRVRGGLQWEPDEAFFVNLSNPTNATIADGQGQGTILNDDPAPAISIDDVTVTEVDFGFVNAVFTVSLSGPSSQPITVQYATADGAAGSPLDYQPKAGTLVFHPGQISKSVVVRVRGEVLVEVLETFFVNLSNPTNAAITDGQGQGTIVNDDP